MRASRLVPTILLAALLLSTTALGQSPASLPLAKPESVGLDSAALAKMEEGMQGIVDQKHLAGIVTLVARHGKVVEHKAYGVQDVESNTPMKLDTIARIYSMTKPITGVAMMMLYEEGKWQPDDPITKYIPEFKGLKVFKEMGADGVPVMEPTAHEPTMRELMSHSAGFTYGIFGDTVVDKLYNVAAPLEAPSLQVFINRVGVLPLLYQPGTKWVYSVSVDIQGYLVEKLSGKTFPEFLRTRLFEPLGMKDTAFYVPKEKLPRTATVHAWDKEKNALVKAEPITTTPPGMPSGGGGLYSTAADYFRFAQMLLNGGQMDGTRYVRAASIDMMRTNQLADTVTASNFGPSRPMSFGFDFAIVQDPAAAKRPVGKGTYWWLGVAGTWFWIDPENDVVFVGIIQRRGGAPGAANHEEISRLAVAAALLPQGK